MLVELLIVITKLKLSAKSMEPRLFQVRRTVATVRYKHLLSNIIGIVLKVMQSFVKKS